ncbi:MAG: hypothetical protein M1275_01875 [Patescibacteria group bacterium]|nr:hypothetical protein [Patescibacteria group bacterium]
MRETKIEFQKNISTKSAEAPPTAGRRRTKIVLLVLPALLLAQGCSFNFFGGGGSTGGVLKSQDSGETWQAANALAANAGSLAGSSMARIRMDFDDPQVLYLASPTSGVYQSTDGAATWTKILAGVRAYDLQVNPKNSSEVMVGGIEGSKAKLFKTEDKGQSWVEAFSEASSENFVSAIAYDPSEPKNVYIGLSTGEIILSKNSGVSWDLVNRLRGRILKVYVDSGAPRTVYALSKTDGLYRTEDGGANWKLVTETLKGGGQYQFFIVLHSPKLLYVADGSGLHKSPDNGATWVNLELPKDQASKIVSAFTVSPKDANEIYAAVLQTLYKSTDGGATWQTHTLDITASVRDFLVDPKEANIIYLGLGEVLQ